MIVIDAYEGLDPAVSLADDPATEKSSRVVDVVFLVDGKGVLVSFLVVVHHGAMAEPQCCRFSRNIG